MDDSTGDSTGGGTERDPQGREFPATGAGIAVVLYTLITAVLL